MATTLAALRGALSELGLDAFVIPSEDPHQSEYVAAFWERREFVSGFTGSAGTAVVTKDEARLWTDARYFLQAEQELDGAHWQLMRAYEDNVPTVPNWLRQLPAGSRVGIDPFVHSIDFCLGLKSTLASAGSSLVCVTENPVDAVWASARPAAPAGPAVVQELRHSGQSVADKLEVVRQQLGSANALVLTALDQIAWLLNVRGWDVECNPVVISYCIVKPDSCVWYVNPDKVTDAVKAHLGDLVEVRPYDSIISDLEAFGATPGARVMLEGSSCSFAIYDAIPESAVSLAVSPITNLKAVKNPVEIQGFRDCHRRDAAALVSWMCWLHEQIAAGAELTEFSAGERLDQFRAEQDLFVGLSFPTIAGYGPNGAIIHYRARPDTARTIGTDTLFLVDSGGQYKDGTTDVTRTIHLGTPTDYQKRSYTRVLQGFMALDRLVFPAGEHGVRLDVVARVPLWAGGLDYPHGTGHGVGSFLNVHEGPQQITKRLRTNRAPCPLKAGMTITNEPGYYEAGNFGIRTENVLITRSVSPPTGGPGDGDWLGFEHVTVVPLQKSLLDLSLLAPVDIAWINAYHAECLAAVGPLLSGKPKAFLEEACAPIEMS